MSAYIAEEFDDNEADILRRYFTNLDLPVFALVNLPEVVKGALFARYSRSSKSLRRLFLDEFVGDLDIEGDVTIDATVGLERAEELYNRVFFEYGDDSVAQLGGVHLACEQASNLMTKVLEWGRLMSYLEQSTRYIPYDGRLGGRYRYFRPPAVLKSELGTRYVAEMDRIFSNYSALIPTLVEFFRDQTPKNDADSDFIYRQAIQAKALDSIRGMLPAAAISNVGIYGSGQAYEALLLRMKAHPLSEPRAYADMMLVELRKVIPSFLRRVDIEDRGVAVSGYLEHNRETVAELASGIFADARAEPAPTVRLIDFDPEGEAKVVVAALYPHTSLPEDQILRRVHAMSVEERLAILRAYVGERGSRRQRPGRALERPYYRFDVLADYGAFRDLQRHRMMTIDWQSLRPDHGYTMPEPVEAAGAAPQFTETMERSAALYETLAEPFPTDASYAVALAYQLRFVIDMNARQAMHMLELRTSPQGHPAYRAVCQDMHRLIAHEAGHHAIAEMMTFVDHSTEQPLERLDAERKAEAKRLGQSG